MDASLKKIVLFRDLQQQMLMVTDEDLVLYAPKEEVPAGAQKVGSLSLAMRTLLVVSLKEAKKYEDFLDEFEKLPEGDSRFKEFFEKETELEIKAETYQYFFCGCLNEEGYITPLPKSPEDEKLRWEIFIAPNYDVFAVPV